MCHNYTGATPRRAAGERPYPRLGNHDYNYVQVLTLGVSRKRFRMK